MVETLINILGMVAGIMLLISWAMFRHSQGKPSHATWKVVRTASLAALVGWWIYSLPSVIALFSGSG